MSADMDTRNTHENRPLAFAFDDAPTCSMVFTFLLDPDHQRPSAINLAKLRDTLEGDASAAAHALINPMVSFFDDIIYPAFRRTTVPLVVLAEAEGERNTVLSVRWPETLAYEAESAERQRLSKEELTRIVRFQWRDSFAIFESGHVAYIVALFPCPPEGSNSRAANEYDILLLQKLVDETESVTWNDSSGSDKPLRELNAFALGTESGRDVERQEHHGTFTGVAQSRLHGLLGEKRTEGHALREILFKAGLDLGTEKPSSERFWKVDRKCLAGGIVHFDRAGGLINDIHRFKHPDPEDPKKDDRDRASADNRIKTLAGIVTNVMDFPQQDVSELRDSLDPVLRSEDLVMFNHPRFVYEFTAKSRSFDAMKDCLGACPYLLLIHLLVTYNERLLHNAEDQFARLVYGQDGVKNVRVKPLAGLFEMLEGTHLIKDQETLNDRLTIFRNLELPSIPNVFRYYSERLAFEKVGHARGLVSRRERFDALLSRYESSMRDLQALAQLRSERLINLILFAIALLAILEPIKAFDELMGTKLPDSVRHGVFLVIAGLSAVIMVYAGMKLFKDYLKRKINSLGFGSGKRKNSS